MITARTHRLPNPVPPGSVLSRIPATEKPSPDGPATPAASATARAGGLPNDRATRRTAPPEHRAQVERAEPSRHDSGRIGRRAAGGPTEALSVADLVRRSPARNRAPTGRSGQDRDHSPDRRAAAAASRGSAAETPPAPSPEPPQSAPEPEWVADSAETTAVPQVVGNPGATRLALSKTRKRKRLRAAGRAVVALVAVVALAGTGIVWGYLRSTEGKFDQIAALDTESTDIIDAVGQTGDETYLIVGTDTRAGASGEVGAGTIDDAEGARADTVMLVNIPADRSRVVAVSFPRDLDVERPVCQGWDNDTGTYTERDVPRRRRRQAQRHLRTRWTEVPGEGDPEDVRPEDRPLRRHGLRRLRVDGRRSRRRRGLHHPDRSRTASSARCCRRRARRCSTARPH